MRVLVTGGSGFIGRNLAPQLTELGHEVLAPDRLELPLLDADAVGAWLKSHRPDAVVHSATKPGHRNAAERSGLLEANLRMSFNLVRDPDLCPKMVFLGSGAEYDEGHYTPRMREECFDAHVPADEHGFSKYLVAKYGEGLGPDRFVDLRLFGVFGPHEDYAIRFISNAACKALFDIPLTLRQDRRFSYLWVEDLAPIVDHFLRRPSRHSAYNVVPDGVVSLREAAYEVLRASGKELPLEVALKGQGLEYSGDNARLRGEMPGMRFTPFEEAVATLYAWYAARKTRLDESLLLHDK